MNIKIFYKTILNKISKNIEKSNGSTKAYKCQKLLCIIKKTLYKVINAFNCKLALIIYLIDHTIPLHLYPFPLIYIYISAHQCVQTHDQYSRMLSVP